MVVRDPIDDQDRVLLRRLRDNARAPVAELAVAAGLAPSSVHERIRRLERRGLIRRWTVDLDPAALGMPVAAFVLVESDAPASGLATAIHELDGVDACHSVSGGPSLVLEVRVRDAEALLSLLDELRALPGVTRAQASMVLRTHFERGPRIDA